MFSGGVNYSVELRRDILLSSKDALDLLRKVEVLREIWKQREEVQSEVHHVFEQLIVLNKKLRAAMPKISVPLPVQVAELPELKPEVEKPAAKQKTKLDILEQELSAIENKLAALE